MRHDRPPKHPAVKVETPVGVIYELDVWLSADEIAAFTGWMLTPSTPARTFEPLLRITCGMDWQTEARIDIVDKDDGA